MGWWVWLVLIGLGWAAALGLRNRRNRRAQLIVQIAPDGRATVQLTPSAANPEDLCLLALCYAAKVRWLLLSESEPIQEIFKGMCGEVLDFWNESGSDLIDRTPSTNALRADIRAAGAGERFVVTLYRTDYRALQNKAWVLTWLPRPGLATNLPWSFLLVLNAVYIAVPPEARTLLYHAFTAWYDHSFAVLLPEHSVAALNRSFADAHDCLIAAHEQTAA